MEIKKPPQKRKAAFWEVGGGKLGVDLQSEFEQAAIVACENNCKVKVKLEITIEPPKRDNIGAISYSLCKTMPKYESISYEAQYDHMLVVSTAAPDVGVLQEGLKFSEFEEIKEQKEAN